MLRQTLTDEDGGEIITKQLGKGEMKRNLGRLQMDVDMLTFVDVPAYIQNSHILRFLFDYSQVISPALFYEICNNVYSNRCGLARHVKSYNINVHSNSRL